MAQVTLKKINKIYDGKTPLNKAWWEFWKPGSAASQVHIVKDVDLEIKDGEFMVLVGPSGCGKSTTLRMVAGLEDISSGELRIGDQLVNDVSPKDRDIAMVFQSYALYPHMSVYDNIAFGLKLRKVPTAEIDKAVQDVSKLLGLEKMLLRKPKELSGGQRQRVAMGRAIVRRPQVYLMDEPLSNLDAKLRVQMRAELQKLHRELGVTTIYVTHDQTEAMTLGDRITIMKDGFIQQVDTPLALYERPNNRYVAGFVGSPAMNFITVQLVSSDQGPRIIGPGLDFELAHSHREILSSYVGSKLILGIRPQDVHEPDSRQNAFNVTIKGQVEIVEPLGSEKYLYLSVERDGLKESLSARVGPHFPVQSGDKLELQFSAQNLHVFDFEKETAICHSLAPAGLEES